MGGLILYNPFATDAYEVAAGRPKTYQRIGRDVPLPTYPYPIGSMYYFMFTYMKGSFLRQNVAKKC